ncbi:MAG: DUF1761 domain-containing protein [Chloroflexota bacterium]|nr:MAG: DUF1761 domain-containing protein [Chloroflexota bacterium]
MIGAWITTKEGKGMITFDVNYVAVVAAAIATMIIGFIWYHPKVLGERWAASSGKTMGDMTMSPMGYGVMAITALISAWAVALIVTATHATTVTDGIMVGAVGWLGFSATVSYSDRMFNGGTMEFWLIQAGYRLVSFVVMGVILATVV